MCKENYLRRLQLFGHFMTYKCRAWRLRAEEDLHLVCRAGVTIQNSGKISNSGSSAPHDSSGSVRRIERQQAEELEPGLVFSQNTLVPRRGSDNPQQVVAPINLELAVSQNNATSFSSESHGPNDNPSPHTVLLQVQKTDAQSVQVTVTNAWKVGTKVTAS